MLEKMFDNLIDRESQRIRKTIVEIIMKVSVARRTDFTDNEDFHDRLGLDSLDMIEIVMYVEKELEIEISDSFLEIERFHQISSVDKFTETVKVLLENKQHSISKNNFR